MHRSRQSFETGSAARGIANRLGTAIAHFRRDEAGAYALMTALLLPVIIGVVGLGTETGLWYFKHLSMQAAVDSGAISAVVANAAGVSTNSDLQTEAKAVAATYGFIDGSNGTIVTLNIPPKSPSQISTPNAIQVIVTQPQSRIFSSLWTTSPINVTARAVAVPANGGNGCVLALDTNAASAISAQGSSAIALNGCNLYDNSSNSTALSVGGSATLSALGVSVVGGISGTSNITTTNGIVTGAPPAADPYASVPELEFSGCDHKNYSAKSTLTLNPGVYCGGMQLNAGAVVTLNPGVYYLDQGSLMVNGGATLQGSGVTLVFTSSTGSNYATANIAGGATINLTAPTSGATAGIVIYGDRDMNVGTALKFTGGSSQTFGGAIYAPKAAISFAGGSGTGAGCTQLIADTISFTGNSGFAINCTGYGTKPLGTSTASLVE